MNHESHLRYLNTGSPGHFPADIFRLSHCVMDKNRVAKFEDILTKKREELRRNLARTQEERQEAHEFGRDEGDRATASLSKEMSFRQKAQERGLLMLVEAALGRVNNGTFGECLNCGQEIGANRLTAVPWSRYCITCQELIVEQQ
jgi:DnaK suppressor protein